MSDRYVSRDERDAARGAILWAVAALGFGAAVAFTDIFFLGCLGVGSGLIAACHAVDAEIERMLALSLDERREALRLLALTPDALPLKIEE